MEYRLTFARHAADWEAEFRRVHGRFAGQMQCRRGCSMCCSQMFGISPLEAASIAEAVIAMPVEERARLRAAARAYLDAAAAVDTLEGAADEESVSPRTGVRLPCPALQDEACVLYRVRPIICRKWGIPVFDPSKPGRLHACELNFRAGDEIDAGDLVERQAALLEEWVALKEAARTAMRRPSRTFTVAGALLASPEEFDVSR